MSVLKCAVIGVGYLGRFHAQKYSLLPNADLIAVCDVNQAICDEVANELAVPAYYNYPDLFGKVQAVSIAATTNQHYEIAKNCIENGLHVLIEKPITETVEQADQLIALAKKHHIKLQVGHLERFNSARLALEPYLDNPLFIESQRVAPFNPRGTDVDVILDLMIHDIDIIQNIVKSPITHIEAYGMPVLTALIDVANARLTFANRCVANVTASRVSSKTERKMRIFQKNSYLSLDYHEKKIALFKKTAPDAFPEVTNMVKEELVFPSQDALLEEIKAFIESIVRNTKPLVSGLAGRNALSTASRITSLIQANLELSHATLVDYDTV
ncbi:MAG: UDP-N-acetyl-D-glucosamine dehydrogenase [Legionellales bacterium RIFCSPHIGHO2_12_FULL_42_9]|nr:MAG: UDP-N-acetyl-D-glucosamine dehydrogenase [Legionellales bacterium RIFCSPHIGHO2_12_FULL_42_9]